MSPLIHRAQPVELLNVRTGGTNGAAVNRWAVTGQNMRCYVRTGVIFKRASSPFGPDEAFAVAGGTLWIAGQLSPDDQLGDNGGAAAVDNLIGTRAAPLALLADDGVRGRMYTGQVPYPVLRGYFALTGPTFATAGSFVAQAEWTAVPGVCADEWEEMKRTFGLQVDTPNLSMST